MVRGNFPYRLYLVISEAFCNGRDLVAVTRAAIEGGVDLVQLREKEAGTLRFLDMALRLKEMLREYQVPLVINDNLEVALGCGAGGLHVGNNDMAPLAVREAWSECPLLGYSVEYRAQLTNEHTRAADYLGISPVFSTATKTDTVTQWGLEGISELRELTEKPLVAIGNMNADNAKAVIRAGADCIAVVSAICQAKDPAKAAYEIRNQIEQA